jgi:hypothetical protein
MKFLTIYFFLFGFSIKAFPEPRYKIDQFKSTFFNDSDKVLMKLYFSEDYLKNKRSEELASHGVKFFQFLSTSMAQEFREDRKKNPFGEIPWPDSLDFIDEYMIDLEKEIH